MYEFNYQFNFKGAAMLKLLKSGTRAVIDKVN